ncbi:MAG: hypothetical protein ACOYNI_06990 [Acidimicrobiia bacterium]
MRRRRLVLHLSAALGCALLALTSAACASSSNSNAAKPTTTPAPANVSFTTVEGIKQGLALIQQQLDGPVLIRTAVIYPEYMIVEAENPKARGTLDSYTVRNGTITSVSPVRLTGTDKNLQNLYPAESVNWTVLAELFRAGGAPLNIDTPPGYLVVEGSDDGTIRVLGYVTGPRRSGRWEADGDGQILDRTID